MVALERAGIPVERYVAYEIEESAIKISKHHYPTIEECGDVFKADFTEYQGFDLLIGGSPCTYWSVARTNAGRETTSIGLGWDLFSQYVRALKESKCKYFLYENNYSMSNDIKEEISKALGVEPIYINSELVSAQHRKRLYWTNIPEVKQPEDKGILLENIIESGMVDRKKSLCIARRTVGNQGSQSYMRRRYFGKSFAQMVFENCTPQEQKELWKTDPQKEFETEGYIRPLTILEMERLQTLDDNYTNIEGISDTQRGEAIGNGWTVDVIAHIFTGLIEKENKTMELRMNEYQLPEKILFNYEELKQELTEKVSMYETLVYTDENIKEAKNDRANLNKLKKALNDERIRREKEYLQPFNDFKAKINEIINIIDKPVAVIDSQIKEYEEQQKQAKMDSIKELWDSIEHPQGLALEEIFDAKWLNASTSIKSIQEAITAALEKYKTEIETIRMLPEFAFEAEQIYISTLDLNKAVSEAKKMAEIAKRKAEREAELARIKAEEEAKKAAEAEAQQVAFTDAKSFDENVIKPAQEGFINPPEEASAKQWVKFQALLSTKDALALKAFFNDRNIEFKAV